MSPCRGCEPANPQDVLADLDAEARLPKIASRRAACLACPRIDRRPGGALCGLSAAPLTALTADPAAHCPAAPPRW